MISTIGCKGVEEATSVALWTESTYFRWRKNCVMAVAEELRTDTRSCVMAVAEELSFPLFLWKQERLCSPHRHSPTLPLFRSTHFP